MGWDVHNTGESRKANIVGAQNGEARVKSQKPVNYTKTWVIEQDRSNTVMDIEQAHFADSSDVPLHNSKHPKKRI